MGIINKLFMAGCSVLGLFLPVDKKKVVFSSYFGRGYSDNSKAIAEAMIKSGTKAKLVWLVKDEKEAATLPKEIKPCPYNSPRRIWTMSTARVWVDNCRKYERFKKKNQFYLQTWHGFPLKRIEKDAIEALGPIYEKGARRDSSFIDLLTSNSAFYTDVMKRCFWYDGEIAEFGTPRNDVFVNSSPETNTVVRQAFSFPEDRKLLLYAPTFRADHSTGGYRIDAARLQKALCKRFGGEWTVLVRLHPNVARQSSELFDYDGQTVADATMYPDMQELLCACDILITDYSSSMFDFALSKKPCFRFANDIEDYMKDRNFYFDFAEIPFPYAENNDEMEKLVLEFDEKSYSENVESFYNRLNFREDGKASERCAEWIEKHLG